MQLFDALPQHIEDALAASIQRFGVLVPVAKDQHGEILDGNHRARIADRLGIKYRVDVIQVGSDEDRREIARTLNADRRQLSEEQRREVAATLRAEGYSLRAIAGAVGTSLGTIQRDLATVSPDTVPDRVRGLDGKSRPARRVQDTSPHPEPAVISEPLWGSEDAREAEVVRCTEGHLAARETFEDVGGCPYCLHTPGERQAALKAREALLRRHPPIVAAKNEREAGRARAALIQLGDDAPGRVMDVKRAERIAREAAAEQRRAEPVEPVTVADDVDIRHGDFREVLADLSDVDAIITDPPYPREFIPLFGDLSALAAKVLRPGGILAVMTGQSWLPDYMTELARFMCYRWTCAYIVSGPRNRVHAARVGTGWKPVLLFTRPGDEGHPFLLDDVFASEDDDKRHHHWGQSESGIAALVERLTEPGEMVCDPFLGGGTTAVVCRDLGRAFVGCDLDAAAVRTSRERVA